MKIYNLVIYADNWFSSTIYTNPDDAIKEVNSMAESQKYLEGENNVDIHEVKDYESLFIPVHANYGKRVYATEARTLFRGEITTMWRVVYEQEVK